jgi:peptide-methionine (S)-S-oxide reductase
MSETATFAGGCFWCVEAALKQLDGVVEATSGYCGGHVDDPGYKAVCRGTTGHAEAVQVEYDPDRISYADLLEVFFTIHTPTTTDREGPDVGSQYRSAIYYHDDRQHELAENYIEALEEKGGYDDPIVTELEALERFWEAEEYHQDYFEKNPSDAYCRMHAKPKVEKVRERFDSLTEGRAAD